MKQLFQLFRSYLQVILSPHACAYCFKELAHGSTLCSSCLDYIEPIVTHTLSVTSKISLKVYALGAYKDPLRRLILSKHYGNRVVSRQLGELMWHHSSISYATFDYIVPIPLHWRRYAYRGYNQAEVMAAAISNMSNKPLVNMLRRVKATDFQSGLSIEGRHANIKDAFELTALSECYKDKHILLIDDLMTTGSTLIQASKTLLPLQPLSITACVVSRVV